MGQAGRTILTKIEIQTRDSDRALGEQGNEQVLRVCSNSIIKIPSQK